jgi:hypothetical protein
LKELKGFKELRRLHLAYVFNTPSESRNVEAGLRELSELPNLEELALKTGHCDDTWLREVAKFKALRVLHLENNKVTDAGLAALKSLTTLRRLSLWRTRVTDAGVADFKEARRDVEVEKDVPAPPRRWEDFERITGRAKVLDANTLLFEDGTRVPLNMRAPGPGEKGAKEAAEFLAGLLGDRTANCFLVEAQLAYVGYVGEVNVEHAMILNGWARAHHSGMRPAETIAQENRRGLWGVKGGWPQ